MTTFHKKRTFNQEILKGGGGNDQCADRKEEEIIDEFSNFTSSYSVQTSTKMLSDYLKTLKDKSKTDCQVCQYKVNLIKNWFESNKISNL